MDPFSGPVSTSPPAASGMASNLIVRLLLEAKAEVDTNDKFYERTVVYWGGSGSA